MFRKAAGVVTPHAPVLPSLAPCTGYLPGGGVEPVEDVGRGDRQQQCGESFLVVVPGGLVPDFVRYRVGAVGQPGDGLGQGQRRALGVGEIRRVPPGGYRGYPVLALARLPGPCSAGLNARAAAVDLAGPQVNQCQRLLRHAFVVKTGAQRLDGLHSLRDDHGRILCPCLHRGSSMVSSSIKYAARPRVSRRRPLAATWYDRRRRRNVTDERTGPSCRAITSPIQTAVSRIVVPTTWQPVSGEAQALLRLGPDSADVPAS